MISVGEMLIRIIAQDETTGGVQSAKENVRTGMKDMENSVTKSSQAASTEMRKTAKTFSTAGLAMAAIGGSITTITAGLMTMGLVSESTAKGIITFSTGLIVLGGVITTVTSIQRAYSYFLASKFVADMLKAAAAAGTLQLALGVIGVAAIALVGILVLLDNVSHKASKTFDDFATNAKTSAQAIGVLDAVTSSITWEMNQLEKELKDVDTRLDSSEKKVKNLTQAIDDWIEAEQTIRDLQRDAEDADLQIQYDRLDLADELLDVRENETGVIDENARKAIQAKRDELDVMRAQTQLDRDLQEPASIADKIAEEEQRILEIKQTYRVESLEDLKEMLNAENQAIDEAYKERDEIERKWQEKKTEQETAEEVAGKYRAYAEIKSWEKAGIPISEEDIEKLKKHPYYGGAFAMQEEKYKGAVTEYVEERPQYWQGLVDALVSAGLYREAPEREEAPWVSFQKFLADIGLRQPLEKQFEKPKYITVEMNIETVNLHDPKEVELLETDITAIIDSGIANSGV